MATAQVLIEHEKSNVLSFKDVTDVDAARTTNYQTQYRLLQSRSLARRVVESLNPSRTGVRRPPVPGGGAGDPGRAARQQTRR